MAIITINSTAEECIAICKAVKDITKINPDVALSIRDVCEHAGINPNKGRFVLADCVANGLIDRVVLVDKGPRYKRFTYTLAHAGLLALEAAALQK